MKFCPKCEQDKDDEDFHKDSHLKDGKSSCCKACDKKFRRGGQEQRSAQRLQYYLSNPEKIIFRSARYRAKAAGIEFSLMQEDVTIPEACPVCMRAFESGVGKGRLYSTSPSLDRWDPRFGYVQGNVWVICHGCNRKKWAMTGYELLAFAQRLIDCWVIASDKEGS